jgi:hypothetical protein
MNKTRKIWVVIYLVLACAYSSYATTSLTNAYSGTKANLHIYLLIGQSNMAGRAPFAESEAAPIPKCYLLNDTNQWEHAKNPLNRYSTIRKGLGMQKMNPGYTFAKTMLTNNINASIGLVVNAKGGTKIQQWVKGSKFYNEAVRRTKIAQRTGVLKGVLWHQGESNQTDEQYLEKLQKLVKDLREDLGIANLPFVAGQVNDVELINKQIAQLPQTVPSTGFASSEGLEAMDRWHFDAPSMRLLGKRYAEQMSKIQKSNQK